MAGNYHLEEAFNNKYQDHLDSLIARTLYSTSLPFHFARNLYFIEMMKYAANNNISGYVHSGYNSFRTAFCTIKGEMLRCC